MFEGFRLRPLVPIAVALAVLVSADPAAARGDADVAALQVGLRAAGVYAGSVDGVAGHATTQAVRTFQRRAGLAADGVAGPLTRAALGRRGRPDLGSRVIVDGLVGWDVAALQFLLAWHGFPSGPIDGHFGDRTEAALTRYQRWAGLTPDGRAGPAVVSLLRRPPAASPVRLTPPLAVGPTDRYGPRGARFHTGVDFAVAAGTPVIAAGSGRVTYAGWHPGGWGYLVTIAHGSGVRTMYAHLSSIGVALGQRVSTGAIVGRVGSTGISSGPHLHFEVRLRGAAIDPAPVIGV